MFFRPPLFPGGRRKSLLGRNEVFLLPSDSDSENDDESSILIRPVPTSPEVRQDNVKTWVATSPFSSPRVSPKKLQVEEDLNGRSDSDILLRVLNTLLLYMYVRDRNPH